MYDSLTEKLRNNIEINWFKKWNLGCDQEKRIRLQMDENLKHWRVLLAIACLLHDIGHPVQSHGFEFLYDDPYMNVDYNEYDSPEPVTIGDELDKKFIYKEQERIYHHLIDMPQEQTPEGNLRRALLVAFQEHDSCFAKEKTVPGNPHERMSAYYILKDKKLGENVNAVIRTWLDNLDCEEEKKEQKKKEYDVNPDLCFIARMIIGWEYPVEEQLSFNEDAFFDSIKNCVIRIVNGTIDADGIDYLMRNSYAAGYDTSKIDSTRLCNAYAAYEKHYVIYPAFSKSALSVLEGYMAARNFEPKWLYSHHKVVYADLLTKRLYKYITRYLTERTMICISVKNFIKHAPKSSLVYDGDQDFGYDLLLKKSKSMSLNMNAFITHIENWSYPFYTYLLAPCQSYIICSHHFSRTADADIDTLFHWIHNELAEYKTKSAEEKHREYKNHLVKSILNNLRGDSFISDHERELRILLSEYCLGVMSSVSYVEEAKKALKAWIDTGIKDNALKLLGEAYDFSPIRDMLNGIEDGNSQSMLEYWLQQYQPLLTMPDFEDFISLLHEYHTRRYRKSLWKSWPEYQLFLKDCANQLMGAFPEDVHRYMQTLIIDGMREHGFSIFDAKEWTNPPDLYKEQFFYQYQDHLREEQNRKFVLFREERLMAALYRHKDGLHEEREKMDSEDTPGIIAQSGREKYFGPLKPGKQIVQKWASILFSKTVKYDFSETKLVVKYYRIKNKRFNKIRLLFNNRPVPLETVFPNNKEGDESFPYFYFIEDSNINPEDILESFKDQFVQFCKEYRESEVRSDTVKMGKNHVFRDAIYGDIEMPEPFYAVLCTPECQRLGRIRQLATADRKFPEATHTRLAHSIGTWHVMDLILKHFQELYQTNPQLVFSEEDKNCALLAALLHDLGHGPYSHVTEKVFGLNHEKMTLRILRDVSTAVHIAIEEKFGEGTAERICKLLENTSSADNASGINLIYHTMISGQLDADRIDYLLRDNAACGMSFGYIDVQQLIASMRILPDYDNDYESIPGNTPYRLCFDDRYLPAVDQFIYARYQMYKNVYHDPTKLLFEQIFERIFIQAIDLQNAIEEDQVFSTLKKIKKGQEPSVTDYISLDDETLNILIKKWASGHVLKTSVVHSEDLNTKAEIVKSLSQAFLNQHRLFEQVDLGINIHQYDHLARRIGQQLDIEDCTTISKLNSACCAFIFISGNTYAYKMYKEKEEEKKNILLRNLEDGTTSDYLNNSLFRSSSGSTRDTLLETDYCYLFFSEELLNKYCSLNKKLEVTTAVKHMVDSAKPRKHIEIETKFYCTKEQLNKANLYLSQQYKDAAIIDKNQDDTYYDYIADDTWILFNKHSSFRCRRINGKFVFTVKIPTTSVNYRSASQFARYEHELESFDQSINDEVFQFLIDALDSCGENEISMKISKEQMNPQLNVHTHRISYRLNRKCEICLDTIDYATPDGNPIGEQYYQIEIELLSEPENWPELKDTIIAPLVRIIGEKSLIYTKESKLEKGIKLLTGNRSVV